MIYNFYLKNTNNDFKSNHVVLNTQTELILGYEFYGIIFNLICILSKDI